MGKYENNVFTPDGGVAKAEHRQTNVRRQSDASAPVELYNKTAERELLGALMVAKKSDGKRSDGEKIMPDVFSRVKPADFYDPTYRLVYQTMQELHESGKPVTLLTLTEELIAGGKMPRDSAIATVSQINILVLNTDGYGEAVKIILSYSVRRELRDKLEQAKDTVEHSGDLAKLAELQESILQITMGDSCEVKDFAKEWVSFCDWLIKESKSPVGGIPSGFAELDKKLYGWKPGQLITLAARPAMGKSALALNLALTATKAGKSVAYFSLEMTKRELLMRLVAIHGGVRLSTFQMPQSVGYEELNKILFAAEGMEKCKLALFDSGISTVADILARCKMVDYKHGGLDLVIIDYMQLLSAERYRDNRVQEISYISRQLKLMAQNMGVAVIALSQLSRAVESRGDKKPQLSDLRESGSIEQDSDAVLMLYRDAYYKGNDDRRTEVIIAKNRHGETGTVKLDFYGETAKFVEHVDVPL